MLLERKVVMIGILPLFHCASALHHVLPRLRANRLVIIQLQSFGKELLMPYVFEASQEGNRVCV